MLDNRREFGRYIQRIREERGISKRRAAAALGYKGLGTIHSVERGINPLPVEKVYPLARLYEVEVGVIVEKLRECEPELYKKFMSLERDFFGEFVRRVRSLGKKGKDGDGGGAIGGGESGSGEGDVKKDGVYIIRHWRREIPPAGLFIDEAGHGVHEEVHPR